MNDIKHDIKKRHKNLTEFRYIAVGFFLTILSGAIMLSPVSYTHLIHYVRDNKETVFAQLRSRLDRFYQKVSGLSHLNVVRKSDFSADEAYDFDESKIIIFTKEAMNGHTLLELLLKKYELQLEMAAGNYVLALASVMDTDEGFDRCV